MRARAREIERANLKLEHKLQRAPTDEEMAAELGIGVPEFVESLIQISHSSVAALDEMWTVSDASGDQVSLLDTLEDPQAADPVKMIDVNALKDRVAAGNPARHVGKRARTQRTFARQVLRRAASEFTAVRIERGRRRQRREQTEIHVHRLVGRRAGIDGLDMATGDVGEQRAMRGGWRWRNDRLSKPLSGREAPCQQSDRSALDIAFAAGDLAGEAQARIIPQP